MSVNDRVHGPDPSRSDLPAFEPSWRFDEAYDPTWVTIYSEATDEIDTQWISIDVDHAIDLLDVA